MLDNEYYEDDQTIFEESHLEGFTDWYKDSSESKIWQIDYIPKRIGPFLFSFDRKAIYNFWSDYPNKLTAEEKELFDKEFPEMAELK
ncbi:MULTISPECIES: DUF7675 family protein [Aerococcus]|uniref:DUF7675 domain-containing protein n=1 Tax=Aerococcus tenax TaxID=3078812 RepID=A0A5N1BBT6_9LACT|nr:hypothetical protein [Aerococcus urinae]KAA9237488.1 hypothetical protein F6I34_09560 [Aerococcus urinae]MDK6597803.1 hypothetical protein [Aerococcus urinae]MDK7302617.1 hypothetical protein [Aerococcus urinae]MDK7801600.1 hypothetical protein [Aerococcus urinae]MDK8654861.1 hypothetical protein [Aerococcus urinae]